MELGTSSDIEKLRHQIALLGRELEAFNNSKESLYKEKSNFDNLLSTTIAEANELKAKKKTTDDEIKKKKQLRTDLNKELKAYSAKLKSQKATGPKARGRLSPEMVKRQIEAMQYAIETEGLSFEKEILYMDRIKRLKAEIVALGPIEAESKELAAKKTQADTAHVEIQKLATESTKSFELLTSKAKTIIEAKAARTNVQTKLRDLKSQIELKNQELAEALGQWLTVTKDIAPELSPEAAEAEFINKFKSFKKLTKDDILKLQRLATR
jgi:uncharacterized coiled-coil DUF342 family protein